MSIGNIIGIVFVAAIVIRRHQVCLQAQKGSIETVDWFGTGVHYPRSPI